MSRNIYYVIMAIMINFVCVINRSNEKSKTYKKSFFSFFNISIIKHNIKIYYIFMYVLITRYKLFEIFVISSAKKITTEPNPIQSFYQYVVKSAKNLRKSGRHRHRLLIHGIHKF